MFGHRLNALKVKMDKLQDLLDNGIIICGKVPWGSGTRNAIITVQGKKYQYNKNKEMSRILKNKVGLIYNINKHKLKSKNGIVIDDLAADDGEDNRKISKN